MTNVKDDGSKWRNLKDTASPWSGESKEKAERLAAEESQSRELQEEVSREVTNFNNNTELLVANMRADSEELKEDLKR